MHRGGGRAGSGWIGSWGGVNKCRVRAEKFTFWGWGIAAMSGPDIYAWRFGAKHSIMIAGAQGDAYSL
jgi:hypothetical protein